MPFVWLIIIATSIPGGVQVQQVPFVTIEACEATIDTVRAQKPEWTASNVIMVCAYSGARQ